LKPRTNTGNRVPTKCACRCGQGIPSDLDVKVVVLEPTGNLIQGLKERLPGLTSGDTIEIDPARSAYEEVGADFGSVPLNLLHKPNRGQLTDAEFERRAERWSGELIQAFKNA
jgi:hypothetical protein